MYRKAGAVVVAVLINYMIMPNCGYTHAYTQIVQTGDKSGDGEGPKLYKAVNFDLLFPKR